MATPVDYELHVKVQTPASIVWEGEASAVSSVNEMGPFDVLPDHSNMITLVESPIHILSTEGEKTFTFAKAVISVKENVVSIYADILSNDPSSSIDPTPSSPPVSGA